MIQIIGKIENRHIVLYKQATPEVEAVKQQKSINGIVADEQGEPIIGASVLEKGTTNGTITDLDGKYSLEVEPNSILVVSYIGYVSQQIPASGEVVNVTLKEDTQNRVSPKTLWVC